MAYNALIVDDSGVTRKVISKTIRLSGMPMGEIVEAANGKEALEQLNAHWIDIVFADINMPVMNGIQLVDEMSARGILQTTPVVIVSTDRSATRLEELRSKGVSACVQKPFTPENVRELVEGLLGPSADTTAE